MKILAVDTATQVCSVALIDDELLVAEVTITKAQTHSKHLMGIIKNIIELAGLTISDMDGFAVTLGPGNFTGLRIGISSIKGLSFATNKPVAGISSLDALAAQTAPSQSLIYPWLDARREQVYCSIYEFNKNILKKQTSEMVLSPDDALKNINENCIFVGSGAYLYKELIKNRIGEYAHFMLPEHNVIRASTVAALAGEKFKTKKIFKNSEKNSPVDDTFSPNYIRKPDAKILKKAAGLF